MSFQPHFVHYVIDVNVLWRNKVMLMMMMMMMMMTVITVHITCLSLTVVMPAP